MESDTVMVVAEVDAGEGLLRPVEIDEVRQVEDRLQDRDECIFEREVDVGPPLRGRQFYLYDNTAHYVAELILNLKLPHTAALLPRWPPWSMGTHQEHCKRAIADDGPLKPEEPSTPALR